MVELTLSLLVDVEVSEIADIAARFDEEASSLLPLRGAQECAFVMKREDTHAAIDGLLFCLRLFPVVCELAGESPVLLLHL